jgi:hypothetical protein
LRSRNSSSPVKCRLKSIIAVHRAELVPQSVLSVGQWERNPHQK